MLGSRGRTNLVLVTHRGMNSRDDFEQIAKHVRALAADVVPWVVRDRHRAVRAAWLSRRPTLVFSPVALQRFRLRRGAVRAGGDIGKAAEYRALERAGLPVPRWTLVEEGREPDLVGFGDYVVVKPNGGGRGAGVRIKKRSRVRWKPLEIAYLPLDDPRSIAQEFVYTGPWPVSYRVTTLFGRMLFAWRVEGDHARRPLENPAGFAGGGEASIVSAGAGCRFTLCEDPDVIALAERAHTAFPEIPLLGIDVVREQPGGKLYLLEVNSGGRVWHLSSPTGRQIQHDSGIDLWAQRGALRVAAEALVAATRRLAS